MIEVSNNCINEDSTINEEKILLDLLASEALASQHLVKHVNKYLKPNEALTLDKRFVLVTQSLGYVVLAVAGIIKPLN
jgi:hypothetical protein